MALKDRVNDRPRGNQLGPRCSTCVMAEQMPDDEREAMNELLSLPHLTTEYIAQVMTEEGWPVTAMNLNRHRRRCAR